MAPEPNRPPFGLAFETPSLEDGAFAPKTPGEGGIDVSLLEDTLWESSTDDEDLVVPNKVLPEGVGCGRCTTILLGAIL